MNSMKNLVKMARKGQQIAANGKKQICSPTNSVEMDATSSSVAHKGHFVIYTTDRRRFMIPLAYLSHNIFRELFKMSEDEFGLSGNGPIIMPCDAVLMEYIVSIIQRGMAKYMEKALLDIIACSHGSLSSSILEEHGNQHTLIYGC